MTQPATTLGESFARGDFHRTAAFGASKDWQTHAALGLCGNTGPALERLANLDHKAALFHKGVIHWINGDETTAIALLSTCDDEYADNLLQLIRKPRISVLAQLPWQRSAIGPHTLLQAGQMDPKFEIRNISFASADLPNEPDADIHKFYAADNPPDFYLAEMVEWHLIPPNLQELPCPLIGQTGDYDLHIQTVYPWLRLFDELVVTDSTEYSDVSGLVDAPVTTFCKPVSLPLHMLPEIKCARDLDLVMTGSLLHSYYPDKAEMMRQMLETDGFSPYFLSGFLPYHAYYPILARSKISVALTRHLGAIPSRGYEALAMGTVLLAPEESCMRLFTDETEGVVPFSLGRDGLKAAIETVLGDYTPYAEAAQRGMRTIREAFDPFRVASQYLRMATFLAARPRPPRVLKEARPLQKRSVAYKGWLQENDRQTHQALRNANIAHWKTVPQEEHTLETFSNPARELLLEFEHCTLMPGDDTQDALIQTALNFFRNALALFPDALALRFNFARAAFHFGTDADIKVALEVIKNTLATDPANLSLAPLDDVMTWDYCQDFFNYRDYLQIVTEALRDGTDRSTELQALILASLNYYYGRISGESGYYEKAATLDPHFSVYRLWQAKDCIRSDDAAAAVSLLTKVIHETLYAPEAWSLLQTIKMDWDEPIPEEGRLRDIVKKMEGSTLIDEAYAAIRVGPYFRAQRLSLARNTGHEFRKRSDKQLPIQISILLADTNGHRYRNLLASLARQSFDRDIYEIIVCDVFDHVPQHTLQHADTVMICGQSEYLYNRNSAFNAALLEAKGSFIVFCDGDHPFSERALAEIVTHAKNAATTRTVIIRSDADAIHTVALSRKAAADAGGLDESAYYAGAFSGPYELFERLKNQHWEIQTLDTPRPVSELGEATTSRSISTLSHEIWPLKFSRHRELPLRENPTIMQLRLQPD